MLLREFIKYLHLLSGSSLLDLIVLLSGTRLDPLLQHTSEIAHMNPY